MRFILHTVSNITLSLPKSSPDKILDKVFSCDFKPARNAIRKSKLGVTRPEDSHAL